MDALRPLSSLSPVSPRSFRSVAQTPAPADHFETGEAAPAGSPRHGKEPTERVRATLFRDGEALRSYQCDGDPVPVRDAQGRLSFVLVAPEEGRIRVRRVGSDGEEAFALQVDGKVQVDPQGGRIYSLHAGRLQSHSLEDGAPLASVPVDAKAFPAPRPGGGVYVKTQDSLRILDADLQVVREVKGPNPGHVAELPGGALALQDWHGNRLVILDAQDVPKCTLDRFSRTQVGPDGALWGLHEEKVARVDVATGAVRHLPGPRHGYLEDLRPRADGSYLVHTRPDLTNFHLKLYSPDGVEVQGFHGQGKLDELQLDPTGRFAYGMVDHWQDEPKHVAIERFDLDEPRRGGLLGLLRGDEEGHTLYRTQSETTGRRQLLVPMVLADGRVAVAGSRDGVLLDRDGSVVQKFASAEEMRPLLDGLQAAPGDLGQPRAVDPDAWLRRQARIHCDEMAAHFGRSQGAFPAVGGVQFSRAAELPTSAAEDVGTVDVARLFESGDLPQRMTFPVGAGSVALEADPHEGDRLVVEVPDRRNPGGFVRKSYWLDEFEHYTHVFPVSTDRGQYVVAADDRGRAWWLDPAGGGDRRFELPGALGARVFSEGAVMVTGKDGATLMLELPGERILRERRPGASADDPDAPRIITTETEVRLGGVSLPIREGA